MMSEQQGIVWRVFRKDQTESTNADARHGAAWDVFMADYQTAGRGRLDHKWLSSPGVNLMMSAVLDVTGCSPEEVATLPLVAGLAVLKASARFLDRSRLALKWPNDVYCDERKLAGILCERDGDRVIAGIGVNVGERCFPPEVAERAISFAVAGAGGVSVAEVRDEVLSEIAALWETWKARGFAAVWKELSQFDYLKGRELEVLQTDDDREPVRGICGGIQPNGALKVGEKQIYAGEAHVFSHKRPDL